MYLVLFTSWISRTEFVRMCGHYSLCGSEIFCQLTGKYSWLSLQFSCAICKRVQPTFNLWNGSMKMAWWWNQRYMSIPLWLTLQNELPLMVSLVVQQLKDVFIARRYLSYVQDILSRKSQNESLRCFVEIEKFSSTVHTITRINHCCRLRYQLIIGFVMPIIHQQKWKLTTKFWSCQTPKVLFTQQKSRL